MLLPGGSFSWIFGHITAGNVAATSAATTDLDAPQAHGDRSLVCTLRIAVWVLYTQNELSGAIFNQSIQLSSRGVKFCQERTAVSSQRPPQGRIWSQGQILCQGCRPWSLRNARVSLCYHKQQEMVFLYESSLRESKFNPSQKFLHTNFSAWRN